MTRLMDLTDERLSELIDALRELVRHREDAKRRRAGAGEPVAWALLRNGKIAWDADFCFADSKAELDYSGEGESVIPLYAHPPAALDAERKECAQRLEELAASYQPLSRVTKEIDPDEVLLRRATRLLRAPDADRRDAERYRWLRDLPEIQLSPKANLWKLYTGTGTWSDVAMGIKQNDELDAAIDAAKAGGRG